MKNIKDIGSQQQNQPSQTQQRQCVKIKQYKYQKGLRNTKSNLQPHIILDQTNPLKILAHKLSLTSQNNTNNSYNNSNNNNNNNSKRLPFSIDQFTTKQLVEQQQYDSWYKKILTPRDTLFKPKRSVFNRYNYENYHNYEYKNPYKPSRFSIDDKMQHRLKVNPKHGSDKNLQIVFCQHRFADFVQKTNKKVKQFYQTGNNFNNLQKTNSTITPVVNKQTNKIKRHQSQSKTLRQKNEIKNLSSTGYNIKKHKTTLSNYLQQFNTLQKLSDYMQRQHKLNQKYLFHSGSDPSRTVLLDIVIHRFQFMKKMKKKCRQHFFKILLGIDKIYSYYKINIREYIKFIQIFTSRDADSTTVATFIFKFLFQEHGEINIKNAINALDMVGGSASRHQLVENLVKKILQKYQNKPQQAYQAIQKDQKLQHQFINLIIL